jgi:DNA (cytosine-5)-methyltransferase 1
MKMKRTKDTSTTPTYSYIDLFSGCGGFSLGLKRAGLRCLAAIDSDKHAVATYRENFPNVEHVLEQDLTTFMPDRLHQILGRQKVDMIVGGPPCQGFSRVRKVDGANFGTRLVQDPRRLLYRNYLQYVEYFSPSIFVMENVPAIRNAAGGEFFAAIQLDARKLGYRVHAATVCAWHYGVPQKRERQLIIGTLSDRPIFSTTLFVPQTHDDPDKKVNSRNRKDQRGGRGRPRKLQKAVTVWEAIGDLPPLHAGEGEFETDYDMVRGAEHVEAYGGRFLKDVIEVHLADRLTAHVARVHSERDLRDFDRLREGETSKGALARGEKMEFPYDRGQFPDRYTRQHRHHLCSTIVAHMSKDGLMYVHPTQRRSLTVREAARLQTFPDTFIFPESKTISYRLVGNAVPPQLGEAVGRGIRRYLSATLPARALTPLPRTPEQAVEWLTPALVAPQAQAKLRRLSIDQLKRAWFSIGFLHNWLHPDGASEDTGEIIDTVQQSAMLARIAPQIAAPAYQSSGWPTSLVPLAREAARRFQGGSLRFDEYYYSGAQIAGWKWCERNRSSEWVEENTN